MIKLSYNPGAMTQYLVKEGVFNKNPVVLADVGMGGGIDEKFRIFDPLHVSAFRPSSRKCEELSQNEKNPNIKYIGASVGASNGVVPPRNPSKSVPEFFARSSFTLAAEILSGNQPTGQSDNQAVADQLTLDQFFFRTTREKGCLPGFLNIEAAESVFDILQGAAELLGNSSIFGTKVRCLFHGTSQDDNNSFGKIDTYLRSRGFELYDISVARYSRGSLPGRFLCDFPAQTETGQVLWADAVYFRDWARGFGSSTRVEGLHGDVESVLKLACFFELYGLSDCACELLVKFQEQLKAKVDTQKLLNLLTPVVDDQAVTYGSYVNLFRKQPELFLKRGTFQQSIFKDLLKDVRPEMKVLEFTNALMLDRLALHSGAELLEVQPLQIGTSKKLWSYALSFPIQALLKDEVENFRYFLFRIYGKVIQGTVGICGVSADMREILQEISFSNSDNNLSYVDLVVPGPAVPDHLVFRNTNSSKEGSTFVIEKVEVYKLA